MPRPPRGAAARQDRGWAETVAAVAAAAADEPGGAFDGALGFSQGAAVLAGLHALRWQRQQQQEGGEAQDEDERRACAAVGRFAVLICGFAPAAPRPLRALEAVAGGGRPRGRRGDRGGARPPSSSSSPSPLLQVPSLHVFPAEGAGNDGGHASCIPGEASWALARLYEPSRRAVLRLAPASASSSSASAAAAAAAAASSSVAAAAAGDGSDGNSGGNAGNGKVSQMLPVTAPRIARVRQFLLEVAGPAVEEEEEEDHEKHGE